MSVRVPLSRGAYALVSREDAERVLAHKWSLHLGAKGKAYACRNERVRQADGTVKRRKILLHRFILGDAPGLDVDHINGDGLDCRRENLRLATRSQNMANTGARAGSGSGYKGVYARRNRSRWRAEITVEGRKRDLGTYRTPEAAALAYDRAAKAVWGDYAFLNFGNHAPAHGD